MRLSISSSYVPGTNWVQAIISVIDTGLHVLIKKLEWEMAWGEWVISPSLENAILKLALKLAGHSASLKAAYAQAFSTLAARWKDSSAQDSFADELFQATISSWQTKA